MTRILALIIIVTVAINFGAPLVAQTDNVVTYQGQLKLNGSPITNMGAGCDFEFSLFADADGVTQIGMTQFATTRIYRLRPRFFRQHVAQLGTNVYNGAFGRRDTP